MLNLKTLLPLLRKIAFADLSKLLTLHSKVVHVIKRFILFVSMKVVHGGDDNDLQHAGITITKT